jgi:hypothetical protein
MTILWEGQAFSAEPVAALQNFDPDRSVRSAFGPPKLMKTSSCSATTLPGGTALPLVIPTGAQRSGGTCGFLYAVC